MSTSAKSRADQKTPTKGEEAANIRILELAVIFSEHGFNGLEFATAAICRDRRPATRYKRTPEGEARHRKLYGWLT